MDIQKLIDEVVAKLKELYAALGTQRVKVGNAIEALTGVSVEPGEKMTPERATALKQVLAELKRKLGQVGM